MNVFYSTHTEPRYIPVLAVSERQVIVGPRYPTCIEDGVVRSLNIPAGHFDVAALISSLPADQRPDLIIALAEAFQICVPRNLAAVSGRKLLLVGDTHHGRAPLQTMLDYAREEPFDRIVLTHDEHHLHWFAEADIAPTTHIPCLNVAYFPQPLNAQRERAIVFVGQAGNLHRRRRALLSSIREAGLPLLTRQAPASVAAALYSKTQITFNCSLNGDLNMRVFETLAAGGFLVTDRLAPQSGLEALFRRGEHYVDYDGVDDLLEKLRHYLARPDECLKIARAGHAAYLAAHLPSRRAQDLMEFAFGAVPAPRDGRAIPGSEGFGENLEERVHIYELLQAFALQAEEVVVVVDPAVGARAVADLVDLPRLRVRIGAPRDRSGPMRNSLQRLGVLDQVDFIESAPWPFDFMLISLETLAAVRDVRSLRAPWLAVMAGRESMSVQAGRLIEAGYVAAGEVSWLFRRAS